jgi:hypothetical protein
MVSDTFIRASEVLKTLKSDDPEVRHAIEVLGDAISVGNISGRGIAIGRNARAIIQYFNLPVEQVADLLAARSALSGLDPEHYQLRNLLIDKTRDFVGREYVFTAINDFLQNHSSGYFIIEGDPGLGKSALLAEYVRRTGCIAHFIVRSQGIVKTSQFLESVCAQLIVDCGLPYVALPRDATQNSAFLEKLLTEASAQLHPGEQIVIAVDALDEAEAVGQSDCANILCLPSTVPDGVYFLLTKRSIEIPLVTQAPRTSLNMMLHAAENRHDVELYLEQSVKRNRLRDWIAMQQLSAADFVTRLAELSESNFMYLRYVLPALETGEYQNLDIGKLPQGLTGYYEDHWRRMGMTTKPLPRLKITVVYIMCEVQLPMSCAMISEILVRNNFAADEFTVQEILDEWKQFLHEQIAEESKRYSVYHASFRDFLYRKDIVQKAGVTIKDINALIVDYLWSGLFD